MGTQTIGDRQKGLWASLRGDPSAIRDKVFMRGRAYLARLRFGFLTWSPKGRSPIFLAYYPDTTRHFPDLTNLYRSWIRDNKINNNGDGARFMGLLLNLRQLEKDGIQGDFAEVGVWRGNTAAILAHFASQSARRVFLFDTFSGFDRRDLTGIDEGNAGDFTATSVERVRRTVGHDELVTYVVGFFPDSITDEVRKRRFAVVSVDCDLYQPVKAALDFFYPQMPPGGMLFLHDYGSWDGATRAIDEFCAATGECLALWPDKSGTAMIRKHR